MHKESPWYTWVENGPELGYTAEIDSFSFPSTVEVGLRIRGIHDQACDGFFPFSELAASGFSPNDIASTEDLIQIKSRHQGPSAG
jgi:hypothetical protein